MSEPYIPGLEQGTSLEGNIEISLDDLKTISFLEDEATDTSSITKQDVSDFCEKGFLLKNVLSSAECQYIIDSGEKLGFVAIRGVRDYCRSCKRITLVSDELSQILWSRVHPFLKDIVIDGDPHDHNVHGVPSLLKGRWRPIGLNNMFRLCRYLPGGHFAPHFDGHYDKSPSERSLVYLNGDFSGGSTNFVDEKQTLYKDNATGKYCAEKENILCSIQPETGLVLLFNHHRLHEGAQLIFSEESFALYASTLPITLVSDELSQILWSRVHPFLKDIVIDGDPHDHNVYGVPSLLKGRWRPIGLNNMFRLCRYLPGGHFAPHFDGHYDKSPSERSLKTLMVYLNGDFSGSSTNFVDEKQTLYKDNATGKYCAEKENILCSIQPETGQVLLFNHHRLHEGAQLVDGKKYILRTDVMYRNMEQSASDNVKEAVQILQQAETLENAGKCQEAMELYRKAFKLAPELENTV